MKWFKAALIGFVLMFNTYSAMAGSGHSHGPVTKQQAGQIAENIVQNMVKQNGLASSWAQTSLSSLEQGSLDGNVTWKAAFTNDQETVIEKQKLNVYLTLTGGFIGAEYSTK